MAVKLNQPLYAATATGTIKKLGTFMNINGNVYLTHKRTGLLNNSNGNQTMKQCFANAKALHSVLPRSFSYFNGNWGYHIQPIWPVFWTQYLADNPQCQS